jgi:hypothetical protein
VYQHAIARWERGAVLPNLETLRRLVRACDLELTSRICNTDLEGHDLGLIRQALRFAPEERVEGAVEGVRQLHAAREASEAA